MQKLTKLLFLPLFASLLLGGCNQEVTPVDPEPQGDPYELPTIDFNEEDYISSGTIGGTFLDVNVGRKLCTESVYSFTYKTNNIVDPSYTVFISVSKLGTYTQTTDSTFEIATSKYYGDFILKIEDADGLIVYRNKVSVVKPISENDINMYLYNVDLFVSDESIAHIYGTWRLSFTNLSPLAATLTGGDDLEGNVIVDFTASFSGYTEYFDGYGFDLTITYTNASSTKPIALYITRAGDAMYIYESGGLLCIMHP